MSTIEESIEETESELDGYSTDSESNIIHVSTQSLHDIINEFCVEMTSAKLVKSLKYQLFDMVNDYDVFEFDCEEIECLMKNIDNLNLLNKILFQSLKINIEDLSNLVLCRKEYFRIVMPNYIIELKTKPNSDICTAFKNFRYQFKQIKVE